MTMVRTMVLCASALAASMPTSYAGPCSQAIDRMRAQIDAKLGALAAGGPSAKETPAATMHRQPTPRSIGAADEGVGDVSSQEVEAITAAMSRARAADGAGDQKGCEQALADAQRALGP